MTVFERLEDDPFLSLIDVRTCGELVGDDGQGGVESDCQAACGVLGAR